MCFEISCATLSDPQVHSQFAAMPRHVFALSRNPQRVRQRLWALKLPGIHQTIGNRFFLTVFKVHICGTALLILSVPI